MDVSDKPEDTMITCSGFRNWADCHGSAARQCPKGYEILSKEENLVTQGRTLKIHCK